MSEIVTVATGEHSAELGELFTALAEAQGAMTNPQPNATGAVGAGREYRYVDLDLILTMVRPIAKEHGLSVIQTPFSEDNKLGIDQLLAHKSGQFLRQKFAIPFSGTPQQAGSLLTYLRRYAVSGLWQLAPDKDDDGKAASESAPARQNASQSRQNARTGPSHVTATSDAGPDAETAQTAQLRRAVFAAMHERWPDCKGTTDEAKTRRRALAASILHRDIPSMSELTDADFRKLLLAAQAPPEPSDPTDPFGDE